MYLKVGWRPVRGCVFRHWDNGGAFGSGETCVQTQTALRRWQSTHETGTLPTASEFYALRKHVSLGWTSGDPAPVKANPLFYKTCCHNRWWRMSREEHHDRQRERGHEWQHPEPRTGQLQTLALAPVTMMLAQSNDGGRSLTRHSLCKYYYSGGGGGWWGSQI